ncbi:actin maturation protease isoform X3 [Hippopotamus amphibius kiboko]|uniref:actin maturation protease isoform X3 n=1 Tax=Hippopotamus amphibius kiboko TaxID=575201 RepID=UPI002596FA0F|nr:actin maturation protease isoform X3 [Hippopotamus amphibius kiboko]
MISPCSPPLEPPIPSPKTPASQAPIIPPPPLPPNGPEVAFAPSPSSLQAPIPPPPPLPPPPATTGFAPPHVFGLEKSQLLKEALERAGPVPRSREDVKRLLRLHKDRFRSDLQWILFCADLPSLIQEGPQCGLVALWMAGTLLAPPSGTPLERLVQVAMERGYTAQGEMFSGVLLGVQDVPSLSYEEDPELPGLFHPAPGRPHQPPSLPEEDSPGAVYLLAKQGKSWHYQLWDYDQVRDSNLQLTDFSPSRAADGREYVVPTGGVRAGLCGQALLLQPQASSH